jgi:rhomboid protease GluP
MTPDLWLVLAAALVALQMAFVVIRRTHADERSYLVLLGVDLAALLFLRETGREATPIAWFFVGLAALLTLVPRWLERAELSAVERGDLHAALRWAIGRSLVVPGQGTTRRRRQLEDLIEVHEHGSQPTTRRLRDQLASAKSPAEAEALHEELVAIMLVDRRFADATEHFGRHLGPAFLLRRPWLLPQLLHAYGETGQLPAAAALLGVVESGAPGRDPMQIGLMQRSRFLFLAMAGADRVLAALLASQSAAMVAPGEREQLLRLARARALSAPPPPPEVEAMVGLVAARAGSFVPARTRRAAPVTFALIAANVAVFVAVALLVPGARDVLLADADSGAPLARAGALFRPAVLAGEWWRAVAAMFLHANTWHIVLNMYGLYLLGRFVEDLCGSARFFVIYFLAGLVGAAATTLVGVGALSVGASGAIMGLLGAMIVIVFLRRGSFAAEWRRMLLWNLVLLTGVQIYIGFAVPRIDNAAHVGGLIGGAAAALLFAPGLALGGGRAARAIVIAVCALFTAASLITLVQVARTPLPKTIARLPEKSVQLDGVALTVPAHWELDREKHALVDPYLDVQLEVSRHGDDVTLSSPQKDEPQFAALLERIRASAHIEAAPDKPQP